MTATASFEPPMPAVSEEPVQRPDAADQSAQAPALSNTGPVERAIHRYASGTAQLYDRRADEVTLDEVERIII